MPRGQTILAKAYFSVAENVIFGKRRKSLATGSAFRYAQKSPGEDEDVICRRLDF